jgi:hypothetical protein
MTTFTHTDYKLIVAVGGGEFMGIQNGCVVFADPQDGYVMKLWTTWCKSPADVADALKCHREFIAGFPAWEPAEKWEHEEI